MTEVIDESKCLCFSIVTGQQLERCGEYPRCPCGGPEQNASRSMCDLASVVVEFPADKLPLYQAAVAQYGDADLYIEGCELHHRQQWRDLTKFWRVFERLEKKQ